MAVQQLSVSDILSNAKNLDSKNLELLLRELNILRIQKDGVPVLNETESALISKINAEFDPISLDRLKFLDWRSEFGALNPLEEGELLELAEAYESYSVERLKNLSQLALLRGITVDTLLDQIGAHG